MANEKEEYPEIIIDILGNAENRAAWKYCGKFPLKEILAGKRACLADWRFGSHLRMSGPMMLAVFASAEHGELGGYQLFVEWESENYVEGNGNEAFNYPELMLLEEGWYLEVEDSEEKPEKEDHTAEMPFLKELKTADAVATAGT
jgi:hypothetical protein